MKKYSLIVENNKELNDYIKILNSLSKEMEINVNIVLLSEIYKDSLQDALLKNIQFSYKLLKIKNPYNESFSRLSIIKKIYLILKNSNSIFYFVKECDVLLSGVQTIFERVIFAKIKKEKLNITTFVYHRHLLFDDKVNTSTSKWKKHKLTKALLKWLGLEGFFIDCKAVGYADYYLVLGNINKNYLITKGVDSQLIFPVGSLEYDDLNNVKPQSFSEKKRVCYITGACEWIGDLEGEKYQQEKVTQYLDYFSNKLDEYEVWIRIHPREDIEKYNRYKSKYPFINIQQFTSNKLLDDLNQFDMLIGGMSTALFEASLLNNKCIIFFILDAELYRYKEVLYENNLHYIRELNNNILKAHKDNIGNDYILYCGDSTAEQRITKLINDYAQ